MLWLQNVTETEGDNAVEKNKDREKCRITEPQINACSAMDCTGAVPLGPDSDEELEAYLDVYQFETPPRPVSCKFTGAANQESDGMKNLMGIPDADVKK